MTVGLGVMQIRNPRGWAGLASNLQANYEVIAVEPHSLAVW